MSSLLSKVHPISRTDWISVKLHWPVRSQPYRWFQPTHMLDVLLDDLRGMVGAVVVGDDDLVRRPSLVQQRKNRLLEKLPLVVRWNSY